MRITLFIVLFLHSNGVLVLPDNQVARGLIRRISGIKLSLQGVTEAVRLESWIFVKRVNVSLV